MVSCPDHKGVEGGCLIDKFILEGYKRINHIFLFGKLSDGNSRLVESKGIIRITS